MIALRKNFIILILLIISYRIPGQSLPSFKSNASEEDKKNSLVYEQYIKKYDAVISYTSSCYWGEGQKIYVLGCKDNKWEFFLLNIKFPVRENIHRLKKEELLLENEALKGLLNFWEQHNFWAFSNDSLNWNKKDSTSIMISDGCSDRYEIFTREAYYVLNAYVPESYQEFIYVKQREQFIDCKKKYYKLLLKK